MYLSFFPFTNFALSIFYFNIDSCQNKPNISKVKFDIIVIIGKLAFKLDIEWYMMIGILEYEIGFLWENWWQVPEIKSKQAWKHFKDICHLEILQFWPT